MKQKYKMICLDVDGVLLQGKEIWLDVHKAFGTYERGKELTEKYLETDYDTLVRKVAYELWAGKDAKPFLDIVKNRKYMKGIEDLFKVVKSRNWISAIVSGGSLAAAKRIQQDFDVDYVFANELIIKNGRIKGYNAQIKIGKEIKAEIIEKLCQKLGVDLKEVIYIGDSNYDIEAFKVVGRAIAFNTDSERLKEQAHVVVDGNDLRDVVPYLE